MADAFLAASDALEAAMPISIRLALVAELDIAPSDLDASYAVMELLVSRNKWSRTSTATVTNALQRILIRFSAVLDDAQVQNMRTALAALERTVSGTSGAVPTTLPSAALPSAAITVINVDAQPTAVSTGTTATTTTSRSSARTSPAPPPAGNPRFCLACETVVPNALLRPCRHAHLCMACANLWRRTNGTCPTCRAAIDSIDQYYPL